MDVYKSIQRLYKSMQKQCRRMWNNLERCKSIKALSSFIERYEYTEVNFHQFLRSENLINHLIREYSSMLNLNKNCSKLINYNQVVIVYGYLCVVEKFGDISSSFAKLDLYLKLKDINMF